MHLISPLISGMAGAESGTAEIYVRGTSTRATWYQDFVGESPVATGADISLDSNGRAEVYVNQYVDVVVRDSSGTAVASFTTASTANNVEYSGQSFTGTDYDDASTGANKPADLQTVLNLWKTTNGAIDWKVLFDGAATSIKTALGALTNLVFNVKDPTYGATGDGTTDDTAAIAAAITAATVNGGVVFLPPGTYKITSALTLEPDTSLIGSGGEATNIRLAHATANMINIANAGNDGGILIHGIIFDASEPNTGKILSFTGGETVHVSDCYFGGTNNDGAELIDGGAAAQYAKFSNCEFEIGSATGSAVTCDQHTSGRWSFDNCRFHIPATCNSTNGIVYGSNVDFRGCIFETGSATSGTFSVYKASSTTLAGIMTGCVFQTSGGATVTCLELGTYVAASRFYEANNMFPAPSDANTTPYTYVVGAQGAQVQLRSREGRVYDVSDNLGTKLVDLRQYGKVVWRKSGTTDITSFGGLSVSTGIPPEGGQTTFFIRAEGGAITNVGAGATILGETGTTLSASRHSAWIIQTMWLSGAPASMAVSERLDYVA